MNSLILLAGGIGSRAKNKIPKQFVQLDSKDDSQSRLIYQNYQNINREFDEIILVVPKEWKNIIQTELHQNNIKSQVIVGGKDRTESSYLGLNACSEQCVNVLIHDSVRPFTSKTIYKQCINNLKTNDAVIPIIPAVDTSILKDSNNINYLKREMIKFIQTPQAFKYHLIKKAYDNVQAPQTDDLQVLLKYNPKSKIKFIKGSYNNFKITTDIDLKILKVLYHQYPDLTKFYE